MANCYNIYTNNTTNSTSTVSVQVGGLYMLEVDGTWSSATATFSINGMKGGAIALADTGGNAISLTASGRKPVYISPNETVNGTIVNAGSGTNLTAALKRVPYSA